MTNLKVKKNSILILAATLAIGLSSLVGAYEIEGNPDRRASIGLNYNRSAVKGDFESGAFKLAEAGKLDQDNFVADIRLPVTSFLTLNLGGGYSKSRLDISFIRINDGYDLSGYNLTAGVRFYLP